MPLTTRCRHCGRLFPVSAQQIKERRGKVDCPQCGKRFDAIGGLLDEGAAGAQIRQKGRGTGSGAHPATSAPAELLDLGEERARGGRAPAIFWSLGILLLIAASILQIGWWDRGKWIQQPQVRAAAVAVCRQIGCRLQLPRLAGTMEIRQPLLSEQEETPGALRLTLILVNNSAVSQRLPQLQLELYHGEEELVAVRRFGPEQYLADVDIGSGLAPSRAIPAVLDLEPPPAPATGFRIKLF